MARHGTVHPVQVARMSTANGGDEWLLVCGDKPVPMPGGVGIFTDPGKEPAEMLGRLLLRATEYTPPVEPPVEDVGPGPGRDHMH